MSAEDTAAVVLDAIEGGASAVGMRPGATGIAGRLVAAGARVSARLLRSGVDPAEAVAQIEAIRPHRADEIDEGVDALIEQMPGEDDSGS